MKIAYIDCFTGISGDMFLGALIDAGLEFKALKGELSKLRLKNYKLSAKKVLKQGISATKFNVKTTDNCQRNIDEIFRIIEKSSLDNEIKGQSKKIFIRIAKAESKIHNTSLSKIHFHELGTIDSIIDIVGSLIGIKLMGIEQICSSELPQGRGFVKFSHGKYPIPAPATIELLKGIPTYQVECEHELVTPTGAAIISTLSDSFGIMPNLKPISIGYGAGSADFKIPNVLRIIIGETAIKSGEIITDIIETNIDDMNPQHYEYVIERLFQNGAIDVFLTNIQMKKNRPGIKLTVISPLDKTERLSKIITEETTSLGVRIYQAKRICIEREFVRVKTKYGDINLKIGKSGDKILNIQPEYKDCVRIAKRNNLPLKMVYEMAIRNFKMGKNDSEK